MKSESGTSVSEAMLFEKDVLAELRRQNAMSLSQDVLFMKYVPRKMASLVILCLAKVHRDGNTKE